MVAVQAEVTMWGTVQHCTVQSPLLASHLFEEAARRDLEPELTEMPDGTTLVEFYADDDTYTLTFSAAQDAADAERMSQSTRIR